MPRIDSELLLNCVKNVESKYKSVSLAPTAAMVPIWHLVGAPIPDNPDDVFVTRRTYAIVRVSVDHGLSVEEISRVLNRRQVEVREMVHAYRNKKLKITNRGYSHD